MRLIVVRGPTPAGPFDLGEGVHHAGRAPECEVCLPSKRVSRQHAVFTVTNGQVTVRDLGSHNGILDAAGNRAQELTLAAGSQVQVGDFVLALEAPPPAAEDDIDLDDEDFGIDTDTAEADRRSPREPERSGSAPFGADPDRTLPPGARAPAAPPAADPEHTLPPGARPEPRRLLDPSRSLLGEPVNPRAEPAIKLDSVAPPPRVGPPPCAPVLPFGPASGGFTATPWSTYPPPPPRLPVPASDPPPPPRLPAPAHDPPPPPPPPPAALTPGPSTIRPREAQLPPLPLAEPSAGDSSTATAATRQSGVGGPWIAQAALLVGMAVSLLLCVNVGQILAGQAGQEQMSLLRGLAIADSLANRNAPALAEQRGMDLDANFVLERDGVVSASLADARGTVLAPAAKLRTSLASVPAYQDAARTGESAQAPGEGGEWVLVVPVRAQIGGAGPRQVVGYAVLGYDPSDVSTGISSPLFSGLVALVAAGLSACLLSIGGWWLVIRPLGLLRDETELALRGDAREVVSPVRLGAMEQLVHSINRVLTRARGTPTGRGR